MYESIQQVLKMWGALGVALNAPKPGADPRRNPGEER
jgi:hypothetical protein